jgi:hypothetical protein
MRKVKVELTTDQLIDVLWVIKKRVDIAKASQPNAVCLRWKSLFDVFGKAEEISEGLQVFDVFDFPRKKRK